MNEQQQRGFEDIARANGVGLTRQDYKPAKPVAKKKAKTDYSPEQTESGPVLDYRMKRFFAAGGFTTFCICCMCAAESGALDGILNVVLWVGGIVVLIGFVQGALSK